MISIIVPVYNVKNYLDKCILSILRQTYEDFELILIDDGSTDGSGELCNKYADKDSRVRVVHKKNEGVSAARNEGLRLANGEYIMFCDSDDYVENTWCEKLIDSMVNEQTDIVICGYNSINLKMNHKRTVISDKNTYKSVNKKNEFFNLFKCGLFNSVWSKIYRKSIIKKNNITFRLDVDFGEDELFNLQYFKYINDKIYIINQPLYNYFTRQGDSLYNKYYYNLFDIQKKLNKALLETGILIDEFYIRNISKYYNYYLSELLKVLNNTFDKKNKKNIIQKLQYNNEIINSEEFIECLKYADEDIFGVKFINELKSGNYYYVYFMKIIHLFNSKIYASIIK